jgi:hypothetical protein
MEIPLTWRPGLSLDEVVQSRWVGIPVQNIGSPDQIDDKFTAAYLVNVCGMGIQWTQCLSGHLTPDPHRRAFTVYMHWIHLVGRVSSQETCPIPKDVLDEIYDTLQLLFPRGHPATEQLLARYGTAPLFRYGSHPRDRQLKLSHYKYFREELEILVNEFNRPPRTWKQLATDRRNLMNWASFWVTVMVAVLTLVSIPCNILQATYTVKSYHATLAQGDHQSRERNR